MHAARSIVRAIALSAAVFAASQGLALAQDQDEEIIVTGTRVEGTSPTQSLSPVDLVPSDALTQQGSLELTDQLTSIAPSINTQRFPISDGTAIIRPVNLRNLPPDSTLVLVNSSRRHRSALVNLQAEPFGTVNQGAQAVDFGIIPSSAIERIEVLRDGASAQYGSDAIAGVINVILRDDNDGLRLSGQYGQFFEGDGENYTVGANLGLPLGPEGFVNLTLEYLSSAITSRGSARPDAAAVAAFLGDPSLVPFNGLGQRWGDPDVESTRFFANAALPLGGAEIYGHASYVDQTTFSGFFYRAPFGVPGVPPRNTLCVCVGGVPQDTPQAIVDDITGAGLDPNDFLTADAGSPSGFVSLNPIHTLFPGGYNPTFGADIIDYAAVLGVRGELGSGMTWDLSGRFARNELSYFLENTINPSLGINSPLNFRPGDLAQEESGVNLDFVMPWNVGLPEPINVAFGAEWRNETYEIEAGDSASFAQGPTATLFTFGSDGFQGDSPAAAGEFERDSYAVYLDLETTLGERLDVGVAGRFEEYDDFGDTFNWKVAGRFEFTPAFAARGTLSTGFRAPTPGQINTLDVTTTADASGALVPQGTFPVGHPVAIILGAEPLDPEDSFNATAGLVYQPSRDFMVTLDLYQIDVDNRIALLTQSITPGSPEDLALIGAGFPGIGTAAFFANVFDTTVRGVELTVVKQFDLGAMGDLTADWRHSYNEQEVRNVTFAGVNAELLFDFENQLPAHRSVLTLNYDYNDRFGGFVRANYYDGWQDLTFGELGRFGSEVLVDAEVRVGVTDQVEIAFGAENVFDEYPDDETNSTLRFLGATRPISSPFGFNGGQWYVRLRAEF
ncbi:MAG TPA: TonB-dependent receptor [Vitreimonas sp.]|nr:TonB-dependent receptor [Vitreimonas sp.]